MRKTSEIPDPTWQDIYDRDERIQALQAELDSIANEMKEPAEHTKLYYVDALFTGAEGYGRFGLNRVSRGRWEICLGRKRIVLYNRKGRRIRGQTRPDMAADCFGEL